MESELVFDLGEVAQAARQLTNPKKHQIVSIVGRLYDPFGVLSPIIIMLKTYLQELCVAKVSWDELVTSRRAEIICTKTRVSPLSELTIY